MSIWEPRFDPEQRTSWDLAPRIGSTLKLIYLDALGHQHESTLHTTQCLAEFTSRSAAVRAAVEGYFSALGEELLSVQVMVESVGYAEQAAPERPRHLRLVASGGQRVLSEDARQLAESAGLDIDAVYGKKP